MNSEQYLISVYEVVGSPLCVASDDGQKVFERIAAALREGKHIVVTFRNVGSMTSAFLNAAVGQLYGQFKEQNIRELLSVQDIENDDLALLKRVVDTAKEYFKDPQKVKAAIQSVTGEETDGG